MENTEYKAITSAAVNTINNNFQYISGKVDDKATINLLSETSGILNNTIENTSGQLNNKFNNYYTSQTVENKLNTVTEQLTDVIENTSGQLNNKFNNYYTSTEINNKFTNYYTSQTVDNKLDNVSNELTNTIETTSGQLNEKFDNYYTSDEINNKFTNYYTSGEVDSKILASKTSVFKWKGTVNETSELWDKIPAEATELGQYIGQVWSVKSKEYLQYVFTSGVVSSEIYIKQPGKFGWQPIGYNVDVPGIEAKVTQLNNKIEETSGNLKNYTDTKINDLFTTIESDYSTIQLLKTTSGNTLNEANSYTNNTIETNINNISGTIQTDYSTIQLLKTTSGNTLIESNNYTINAINNISGTIQTDYSTIQLLKTTSGILKSYTDTEINNIQQNYATIQLVKETSGNTLNEANNYSDNKVQDLVNNQINYISGKVDEKALSSDLSKISSFIWDHTVDPSESYDNRYLIPKNLDLLYTLKDLGNHEDVSSLDADAWIKAYPKRLYFSHDSLHETYKFYAIVKEDNDHYAFKVIGGDGSIPDKYVITYNNKSGVVTGISGIQLNNNPKIFYNNTNLGIAYLSAVTSASINGKTIPAGETGLIQLGNYISGIQMNGTDVNVNSDWIANLSAVTSALINEKTIQVGETGLIKLGNYISGIQMNGTDVNINSDGIADLSTVVSSIYYNEILLSSSVSGRFDLPIIQIDGVSATFIQQENKLSCDFGLSYIYDSIKELKNTLNEFLS